MAHSVQKFEERRRRAEPIPDDAAESCAAIWAGEKRGGGERGGDREEFAAVVYGVGDRAVAASDDESQDVVPSSEVDGAAAADQSPGSAGVAAGYGARGSERLERRGFDRERQGDVRRAGTRGRGGPSVGPNNVPYFWSRPKREIVMACLNSDISRCWWGKCWRVLDFPARGAEGGPDPSGSLPFGWTARSVAVVTRRRSCGRAPRAGG
jgi:hypothetical protein